MIGSKFAVNFNSNSIGGKYYLIVFGGGFLRHVSVLTSLLVKKIFLTLWIETLGICHDYGSFKQGNLCY